MYYKQVDAGKKKGMKKTPPSRGVFLGLAD
jgi:hypothetical protein